MKVIPVIDVLNGVVVHAVRGKRSEYQRLQSGLCNSVDPVEVAKAFEKLGFGELYIADLDAIVDCSANFQIFKRITEKSNVKLLVDAGVTSIERAEKLLASGVAKLIIGTETLTSKSFVEKAVKCFGSQRVVVSLDLRGNKIVGKLALGGDVDALGLLQEFKQMGVSQLIVLDLARVGSGEGVNTEFLREVIAEVGIDVYVGGGVRNIEDLMEISRLGVSGALVATALHSGKISVSDLKKNGFL